MSYKFTFTKENGYIPIDVSKETHKELFPRRELSIFTKYEYLYNKEKKHFIILCLDSKLYIAVNTLLYPANLLFCGLSNYRSVHHSYHDMYNQKETGTFVADEYYHHDDESGLFFKKLGIYINEK